MGEIIVGGATVAGVLVESRRQIRDDRGAVMHVLTERWPHFQRFGEVYVSLVNPGVVKAWKRHREMTQHFAVPMGEIKLLIHDDRTASPTRGGLCEIHTGVEHYGLVRIPPGVWYGFKALGETPALIVNCSTLPHDPAESEQCAAADFPLSVSW